MSHKSISINEHIYSILKDESFNNFTVTQLRDRYMAELSQPIDSVEARQIVYRQVLRFSRQRIFQKEAANNARESTYRKTPKFFKTRFKIRLINKHSALNSESSPRINVDSLVLIEGQLKQYKVDLLASVGESEEYMRLYQSNPELKTLLESEYLQARDQSSRLLGQIKALDTVLRHCSR